MRITDDSCTHPRRALLLEEFSRLIEAAANGPTLQGISGTDRVMLYILACWTGYRRSELASLTLNSFDLMGTPPTVSVQAGYTKNKRFATIPLHAAVVERLASWLDDKVLDSEARYSF